MKIETINLEGKQVQYRVIPKNNKNTYFKFRKNGVIEITKSRYQTKKDIIAFMKDNARTFVRKIERVTIKETVKEGYYNFFGEELEIDEYSDSKVHIDLEEQKIYIPSKEIDPEQSKLRKMEREIVKSEALLFAEKYMNNPFVNINGITIKVRHTKTRFGSCNAKRRSINLNANLIHYDKKYLEYVFLHEIAHLVHQDHSKKYYELLEKLCPIFRTLRKELREIYR